MVIDESAAGSVIENGGIRGTIRWMAPELMYAEMFDFVGECQIRLPSRGTDIYALGMTILEVNISPLSSVEKLLNPLSRLSLGVVHLTVYAENRPSLPESWMEVDQKGRRQASQTNCGNW